MEKVEIIRVNYEQVELYLNDDHIGTLHNDLELQEVQIQVAQNRFNGYHIKWKDRDIIINDKGELSDWPKGMYSGTQERFAILFNLRKEINAK